MSYNSLAALLSSRLALQDDDSSPVVVNDNGPDGAIRTSVSTIGSDTSELSVAGPTPWLPKALECRVGREDHVTWLASFANVPAYTILFRYKPASVSGTRDVAGRWAQYAGAGGNNHKQWLVRTLEGTVRFYARTADNAKEAYADGPSLSTNNWHTIAIVATGSVIRCVVDGVSGDDTSLDGPYIRDDGLLWTLAHGHNGSPGSGSYADVACIDQALSSAGIAEWEAGPEPLNILAPVLHDDGTVTSGTWDSQSNGTITRFTTLHLASNDSLVASSSATNPDFSGDVTPGLSYYVIERASNDGGYDEAEDTASAVVEIVGGGSEEPEEVELGQSASSETTQSLLASNPRSYALGQSSSTEATQPLAALNPREYTAGQSGSVEASQLLIVSNPRSYEIGQSSSSESVQSLSVSQAGSFAFGQSSSTESSQSLVVTNPRSYTIGQSSSTESSSSLEVSQANVQTVAIGQSSSIEAVMPLIISNPRTYAIGQSVSTEHASDLIVDDGTATTSKQYVFQTIDGPYFFQTQS